MIVVFLCLLFSHLFLFCVLSLCMCYTFCVRVCVVADTKHFRAGIDRVSNHRQAPREKWYSN